MLCSMTKSFREKRACYPSALCGELRAVVAANILYIFSCLIFSDTSHLQLLPSCL